MNHTVRAMLAFSAVLLPAFVFGGCPRPSPVPPSPDASDAGNTTPDPGPDEDPEALLDAGAVCPAACARLRRLGCPEGAPAPGGDSCVGTCINARAKHTVDLRPECIAKARTKSEAIKCGTVDCGGVSAP